MYLNGYKIIHANGKISRIKKNDFAGDTIHTHRAYSSMVNGLLSLTEDSFPLKIFDEDSGQLEGQKDNQAELLNWIRHEKK